jgi:hypothetical protein
MQLKVLMREYEKLQDILPKGEKFIWCHIYNAKFISRSHWITPKLEQTVDKMCLHFLLW